MSIEATALIAISVAVLNCLFKIESINGNTVRGIILSILGVVLVITGSESQVSLSRDRLLGGSLLFIGQELFAYYMIFSKKLLERYSSYQIMAYVITISSFFFWLVAWRQSISVDWFSLPIKAWLTTSTL